jgi:tetratricopeptide (TPR) repeat protein
MGQPQPARQVLQNALPLVRQTGDRFAEKLVLERMGMAHANLGDPAGALALANQALEMTRALGDRQQEVRLLWNQAIAHADMNQRELAMARAQESVDLLRKLGKPEASWYGAQLQRYRMDLSGLAAQSAAGVHVMAGGPMGGSISTTSQSASDPNIGPGLLRMAVSATKAMMKFIGSGLKTTPPDLQQSRMATCERCEHHTGMRCRVCGCFTHVKTRMAHEQCPIGKWPG